MNIINQKNFILSSTIYFVSLLIFKTVDFFTKAYIGRNFGPEELGIFNVFISLIFVFSIFIMLGLNMGVKRFIAELYDNEKEKTIVVFLKSVFVVILNSFLIMSFLILYKNFFIEFLLINPCIFKYLLLSLPLYSILQIFINTFEAMNIIKYSIIFEKIIRPFLFLFSIFVIKFFNFNYEYIYFSYFFGLLLIVLLFLIPFLSAYKKVSIRMDLFPLKKMLTYSIPLMFNAIFYILPLNFGVLFIQYYYSSIYVGFYSAALEISKLITFVIVVISPLFFTICIKFFAEKKLFKLNLFYQSVSTVIYFITLPIFIIFFMFSGNILNLFGVEFINASYMLKILSVGFFIDALVGPVDLVLNAQDRTRLVLQNSIISFVIGFLFLFLFLNVLGIYSIIFATFIIISIQNILGAIEIYFLNKINVLNLKKLIYFIILTLFSIFAYFIFNNVNFVFIILIILFFYTIILFKFEKNYLKKTIFIIKSS